MSVMQIIEYQVDYLFFFYLNEEVCIYLRYLVILGQIGRVCFVQNRDFIFDFCISSQGLFKLGYYYVSFENKSKGN